MESEKTELTLEFAQDRIEYLERLVKKYKYCALTNLMKDQDFNDKFHRVFEEFQFTGEGFTLAIIDINYLHNVNKQGWEQGNNLIKSVADQLKEIFAAHQLYRIGGDEFCAVVRDSYMSYDEVNKKLATVTDVTFAATKSTGFATPSKMFKDTDAKLTKLKLARPDFERRM